MRLRPRLLPAALAAACFLLVAKLAALLPGPQPLGLATALASSPTPPPAAAAPAPAPEEPTAEQRAERALLEGLRARRAELDSRDQALAAREMVVAAAERRLGQRIEELGALQQRLQSAEQARTEREEAGWRQMVKLYEGMRPRDAAAIFDDLEMPVLVQLVDRMREAKAAPVLGAMKPDRARLLTAELARHRARPVE
ncbi:MotE family protein [Belnapia rosea]|uniref:Flagellar motility protein MotE, a chaperone for MotC folding n=1 Tax=Belnapia rosea TaxID=938405 RepID=A0A1G6PDX4_9PROT|nr:hypothetical protein [Belnapia rosea]SDB54424.1 Flagellar motility protein MotE, a chaperone for MotC folding [Belnapia rosea]SDC77637.1 Flagellar motility protein MotE, a chaperone for MotC folding [Belnapia rosea]